MPHFCSYLLRPASFGNYLTTMRSEAARESPGFRPKSPEEPSRLRRRIELLEWSRGDSMSRMMETRHLNPPLLLRSHRSFLFPSSWLSEPAIRRFSTEHRARDMAWQAICRPPTGSSLSDITYYLLILLLARTKRDAPKKPDNKRVRRGWGR